ncbi:hypothetical protein ACF1BE_19795 [Streptomyces sp. NPDC014991]|uniref:hypothetical protein n=1 Tax=Streptomyces sp. NPDC014991 TaxID=3364935 RepID=UPI0036F954A6
MSTAPTTMQWIRSAAQRISRGSGRLTLLLARRITRRGTARLRAWGSSVTGWLGQASGLEWLLRAGCLVVLGLIVRHVLLAVSHGLLDRADTVAARLMWPASIVWVAIAYRIGREDWKPRAEPTPADSNPGEDDDQGEPEDAVEHTPAGPPLPTREQLAEALAEVGTPHAHIAALAEYLGTTSERVRAALDGCGVVVEPVRMRGRGSSTGIKGGSLPAPGRPLDAVVTPGQPANNNDNNATTLAVDGRTLLITDDVDNPYRHHVHYLTKG